MNKYLVLGLGTVVLLVAGYFLLTNQANRQTTVPSETLETPTPVGSPSAEQQAEERKVNLTKTGFEPETLKIKAGTKVIWENKSGEMGNVSSVPHPTHTLYPFLNLGNFDTGETLSVTFEEQGTYRYHNHLNSSQTGTVVVE